MPPHDRPTTQVGATMEVAPRKEEERSCGTPLLLSVKSEDSAERQITETPLDLQCKFITMPQRCNPLGLPALENGGSPTRGRADPSMVNGGATLSGEMLGKGYGFGSASRLIGVAPPMLPTCHPVSLERVPHDRERASAFHRHGKGSHLHFEGSLI
jgi:hypothetical protein